MKTYGGWRYSFTILELGTVGIGMGYGLAGRCSIPARGNVYFSIPLRSDRTWSPYNTLSDRHREFFPRGKAAEA
jgi:hypothetical protein